MYIADKIFNYLVDCEDTDSCLQSLNGIKVPYYMSEYTKSVQVICN